MPADGQLQTRRKLLEASAAFYDALPALHQALLQEMAREYGMTVPNLVYDVWRERIERWIAGEGPTDAE